MVSSMDQEPKLDVILRNVGIGVASVSSSGEITFANDPFKQLLRIVPAGYRPVIAQAHEERQPVRLVAFDPAAGWLTWFAKPVAHGFLVQVYRSMNAELDTGRRATEASTDPYSGIPNRRALMIELESMLSRAHDFALILAEPGTPPGKLKLDLTLADRVLQSVVATVEPHTGVSMFRVSPLGFAAIAPGRSGAEMDVRVTQVISTARTASLGFDGLPSGLDFIGGAATSSDAHVGPMLYLQASHALQSERAAGTSAWRWQSSVLG
jgi:GGDEF domain-containing protein